MIFILFLTQYVTILPIVTIIVLDYLGENMLKIVTRNAKRGFSLPELLIVLVIIGILSTIAIVSYSSLISSSESSTSLTSSKTVARSANGLAALDGNRDTTLADITTANSEVNGGDAGVLVVGVGYTFGSGGSASCAEIVGGVAVGTAGACT